MIRWDVDERPPTPYTRAYVKGMWLSRDKAAFEAHWNRELDHWFQQGIDTPGLVMIKVVARRISLWDGDNEAEIPLPASPAL